MSTIFLAIHASDQVGLHKLIFSNSLNEEAIALADNSLESQESYTILSLDDQTSFLLFEKYKNDPEMLSDRKVKYNTYIIKPFHPTRSPIDTILHP